MRTSIAQVNRKKESGFILGHDGCETTMQDLIESEKPNRLSPEGKGVTRNGDLLF
jgi:hypothetical protein